MSNLFTPYRHDACGNGVMDDWASYWMPGPKTRYVKVLQKLIHSKQTFTLKELRTTRFSNTAGRVSAECLISLRKGGFIKAVSVKKKSLLIEVTEKGKEYIKWLEAGNKPRIVKQCKLDLFIYLGFLKTTFKHWFDVNEDLTFGKRCTPT